MCSIDIFINRQLVGLNFAGGSSIPRIWWLGARGGREWAHSIARQWVPIGSPLTHMVYLLEILLPLDEAVASGAVFVIVAGSDGRAETLLEPAK